MLLCRMLFDLINFFQHNCKTKTVNTISYIKDNLLTYIGKVYQKSLILQKISKCHLPKQHFRNFLSLAKPGELVVRRSNDRTQWRRRMFGQESITFTLEKAKETLDSFNRLKDILEFRTNQLFIELVVQTINSSQNEETRKIVTAAKNSSSKETVFKPTNLARRVSTEIIIVKDKSAESIISSPRPALAGLFTPPSALNSCFFSPASLY